MSGQSQKSDRKTLEDSRSATGSPALEPGHTHYAKLDGQMILPFGQAPVPVSLSVQAGSGKASPISVTYGPHGSGSFWSAVLTQSLASRLRAKTDLLGSTLFRLTWKERVTPSGRVIPALRATGRRTSGNDSILLHWPTPQEHDKTVHGNTMADHHHYPHDLSNAAQLASWPTPNTMDTMEREEMRPSREATGRTVGYLSEAVVSYAAPWPTPNTPSGGPNTKSTEKHTGGMDLEGTATLANWATPSSRDWKDTPGMSQTGINPDGSERARLDQLPRQALLTASGSEPNGSGAATKSTGQLNPSLSRWLMSLPISWDVAAMKIEKSSRRSSRKPGTESTG